MNLQSAPRLTNRLCFFLETDRVDYHLPCKNRVFSPPACGSDSPAVLPREPGARMDTPVSIILGGRSSPRLHPLAGHGQDGQGRLAKSYPPKTTPPGVSLSLK